MSDICCILEDMEYREFLERVLKEVSEIANEKFGKVSGTTKTGDNNQVLTEADLEIGKHIISAIEKEFPNHNIIDEEAGVIDKKSDFTWVVDPIDGTSNFVNGISLYGIMFGLLEKDNPIAGGFSFPYLSEVWTAEKGQGTYCNNTKIIINNGKQLESSLISYGIDAHPENPDKTRNEGKLLAEIVLNTRNLRMTNCTPLDAAWVCMGKVGGSLNQSSKIWDNVAQQIIIEEAGGICTDFWGNPLDFSNPLERAKENFTYCAAPPELHKQLQEIIHRI